MDIPEKIIKEVRRATNINTIKHYLYRKIQSGRQYILSKRIDQEITRKLGCKDIEFARDGNLSVNDAPLGKSFYEARKYGMMNMY